MGKEASAFIYAIVFIVFVPHFLSFPSILFILFLMMCKNSHTHKWWGVHYDRFVLSHHYEMNMWRAFCSLVSDRICFRSSDKKRRTGISNEIHATNNQQHNEINQFNFIKSDLSKQRRFILYHATDMCGCGFCFIFSFGSFRYQKWKKHYVHMKEKNQRDK